MSYETGRFTRADPMTVNDRETFISFADALLGDFRLGGGQTDWENTNLGDYLEAVSDLAEVGTMFTSEEPTWRVFAQLLAAATGYE